MRRAALLLFWSAAATLAYTFVLFPAIVMLRGLLRPRPVKIGERQPRLSVIVAAHNEARAIADKIENLLGLDYPASLFEVIVASDGSDDETNDIVAAFGERGVRLLALPRGGKAAALDAAVNASGGEVLVFSDANSMFGRDALAELARPFNDPTVGGVAGNQVYRSEKATDGGDAGELAYWSFDRTLKGFESRAGNAISATGAIYAIRRELYRPIPPGVNDDFFLSLGVIRQGRRLVFAANATAYEPAGGSLDAEYARKVRVLSRAMRCVVELRDLFDYRRHGFYSIQLFSHKVLRWAMVLPVGAMTVSSVALMRHGRLYLLTAAAALAGYAAAGAGIVLRSTPIGRSRLLSMPAYFVMANAATAVAGWNLLRGRRIDRWQPARERAEPPTSG